ncbi:TLC domain-containing protein 2-like [Oculina patagonica]
MLDVFRLPDGSYEILGFFVVFRVLHFFLTNYTPIPSSLATTTPRKIWLFRNVSVSFIHSCISAVLSVYSFFDDPSMLTDMLTAWSGKAFVLVAMSTGYFLHDFFDTLIYDARKSLPLLLHHVVVCSAFCLAIFNKMYIAFGVCSLLMEVNSVFLHFRQLMNFHGVSKTSLLYQVNGILLLITFVNFRFLTGAWMTNYVIQHRNVLPFWHFMLSAVGMAIVTVLNIGLFMHLWRSDFKREQTKQRGD